MGVKMSGHGRKKVYGEERAVRGEFLGMGGGVGEIGDDELGGFFRHV